MASVLKAAWRVVARRTISDKVILAAAFTTVLLAVTLLAAGPIYADAVTVSSLRRALVDAPVTAANVELTTRVTPDDYLATDDEVVAALEATFRETGADIYRTGTSDSFSLAGLEGTTDRDLAVFRFFSDIESRVEIVEGEWPAGSGDAVPVAVLEQVAEGVGLEVGDSFEVVSRRDEDLRFDVVLAGVYRIADVTDPYWLDDPLDLTGMFESPSFTTWGPFVIDPEAFFSEVAESGFQIRWGVFPHHEMFTAENVNSVIIGLDQLDERLNSGRDLGNLIIVETDLASILRETERSLLVTRSAVLVLTIQLAVLAGYALVLTSGLLADTREVETTTLRARGASNTQLVSMSIMEGLLLAVPAFLAGPPLASWLMRTFNIAGPLAGIDLAIEPAITSASWALAGVAAVGSVFALVLPARRSIRRSGSIRAARARPETGKARRAGADIALLVIAAVGIWQLTRYGSPLTEAVGGRLGVDPLLVAAPALALLAGAVLALRILPLLARLGEGTIAAGRRLVPSLGVWHLGRQPQRFSRSALLLMLALAIGIFALAYDATWQTSQADQSDFIVGSDILVAPSQQAATAIPPSALQTEYQGLPGYREAAPILRQTTEISGVTHPVAYTIVDSENAADLIRFREDLSPEPIGEMLARLNETAPRLPGIALTGRPTGISAVVTVHVEPLDESAYPGGGGLSASLRAVLVDAVGQPFRVDMGVLDQSGSRVTMSGEIGHPLNAEETLYPEYPLTLAGFEVRSIAPSASPRQVSLGVEAVATSNEAAIVVPGDATTAMSELSHEIEAPEIALAQATPTGFEARFNTGSTDPNFPPQAHYFMIWMGTPASVEEVPILVAGSLLDDLGLSTTDAMPLIGLSGYEGAGRIVGEFAQFPTVDPRAESAVVIDYPTYLAASFGPGVFPPTPNDYWLAVGPEAMEIAANDLRNLPFSSASVATREEVRTELTLDPVSLGTIGSLMMGLVAAAVLATIGFLVNLTVTTRDRVGQFALMRAIGLSRRELLSWVAIENGYVMVFGVGGGTGLGILLASLVLPLIAVNQDGTQVVPDLVVVLPWPQIIGLVLAGVAVLAVGMWMVARIFRSLDLASLLRSGDE